MSESLPMLEHMGVKVLDERPHRVTPQRRRAHLDARSRACWPPPTTPKSRSIPCTRFSSTRSDRFSAARSRTTNSTGSSSRRGCRRRRSSILRAYAKYLRQIGFPLSQSFIEATLAVHSGLAATTCRTVQGAVRSGRRRRCRRACGGTDPNDRGRARCGRESFRGSGTPSVSGADSGDDANELLASRWRGPRAHVSVVQVRSVEGTGTARTQADVRDLRLFDAVRRRASARAARSRAAACAGPIGRRISAPKCSAWSRRRWSRTP